MKYCPLCQTSYTDESLKFCNRDGAPLEKATDLPTAVFNEEATVVSSRQVEPIRVHIEDNPPPQQSPPAYQQPPPFQQQPPQQQYQPQYPPPPVIASPPPFQQQQQPQIIVPPPEKKSRTGLAIALTVLGMLALGGIVGALYATLNRKPEVAVNVNNAPSNRPSNAANQTANAPTPTPTATATATPRPTLDPNAAKAVTADVGNVVDDWKISTENLDIETHLGQYAATVDYYKGGKVSSARIRADRQRAFDIYDAMVVNISNLKVTPDAAGDKAVAVFDKEWDFSGEDKYSSGKVQQQLTFAKVAGSWKITGEKDLKLYYKDGNQQ